MTDRISTADPDAVTALIWLGLFFFGLIAFAWVHERKTRRRNRWLPKPRPDGRSSIEYSKPHMPKGQR